MLKYNKRYLNGDIFYVSAKARRYFKPGLPLERAIPLLVFG
jgi:hypothetical protein